MTRKELTWPAVLLVVLRALVLALAGLQADQLAGSPVADALTHVLPLVALGADLPPPANSALLSNSLVQPLSVRPDWA